MGGGGAMNRKKSFDLSCLSTTPHSPHYCTADLVLLPTNKYHVQCKMFGERFSVDRLLRRSLKISQSKNIWKKFGYTDLIIFWTSHWKAISGLIQKADLQNEDFFVWVSGNQNRQSMSLWSSMINQAAWSSGKASMFIPDSQPGQPGHKSNWVKLGMMLISVKNPLFLSKLQSNC